MSGTSGKHLHFTPDEFASRQAAAIAAMEAAGLSALLIFRQESMYWLSGYDTFGYVHFQAMVLTSDGRMALITRSADRLQAGWTSLIPEIRIWVDGEDAQPERDLRDLLQEYGLAGRRIGVEWDAWGLTAAKGRRVSDALDGFGVLEEASQLITGLRAVKSRAEIFHVRRAAELADAALEAAEAVTGPGAYEGDILAELQGAIYRGGGDDPANEQILGSGPGALMCRYYTGRRHLSDRDQLTLEFAAGQHHYHAGLMRTIVVGEPDPRHLSMHAACTEALLGAEAALRPGEPGAGVFEAHARAMERAGFGAFRLNACGYSMGATFAPSWMDWPMFYAGQSYAMRPGNTFFLHMILFDEENGLAMSVARTSLVTETGAEPLSALPLELIRR